MKNPLKSVPGFRGFFKILSYQFSATRCTVDCVPFDTRTL